MVVDTTYYDELEVQPDASKMEIKKAYLKMQRMYHPDRCKDEKDKDKCVRINKAYEVLKDDEKRQAYDRYGVEGAHRGGADMNTVDIFERMFGGFGGGGRSRKPTKADYDLELHVKISLQEAFRGQEKKIKFKRKLYCNSCDSTGSKNKKKPICNACGGKGQVAENISQGFTMFQQIYTCPKCSGSGKMVNKNDKCGDCKGRTYLRKSEEVSIVIPPGVEDKKIYAYKNLGNSSLTDKNLIGDLKVVLLVRDHKFFNRVGSDLYCYAKIDYIESLCGFARSFTHLDGTKHTIKYSGKGKPIVTDAVWRIPRLGMPGPNPGVLNIIFNVIYPTESAIKNLTPDQVDALRNMLTPVSKVEIFDLGEQYINEAQPNDSSSSAAMVALELVSSGMKSDRQHHNALVKEQHMQQKEEAKRQNRYESEDEQDGEEFVAKSEGADDDNDDLDGQQASNGRSQGGPRGAAGNGGQEMTCHQS